MVARLAGVEIPVYEDNEKTLADLTARIAKAIAFIQIAAPVQCDGTEDKGIRYKGMQFLLGYALPNFYLHVTSAYSIPRHNGIEIGRRGYLGSLQTASH